jgi:hypothetical protein
VRWIVTAPDRSWKADATIDSRRPPRAPCKTDLRDSHRRHLAGSQVLARATPDAIRVDASCQDCHAMSIDRERVRHKTRMSSMMACNHHLFT